MRRLLGALLLASLVLASCRRVDEPEDPRLERCAVEFEASERSVRHLTVAGQILIGAAHDAVHAWDVETGRRRWTFPVRAGKATAVLAGPGGEWFACGYGSESASSVEIRDVRTGTLRRSPGRFWPDGPMTSAPIGGGELSALITAFAVDPAGAKLVAVGHPSLTIWSIDLDEFRGFDEPVQWGCYLDVAFGPDGRTFVTCGRKSRKLYWWGLDGGRLRSAKAASRSIHRLDVFGGLVACYHGPGRVTLVDFATGAEVRSLSGELGSGGDVVFSPDGSQVFAAAAAGVLRAWDRESGEATGEALLGFPARALAMSGDLIYVAGDGLAAYRWR